MSIQIRCEKARPKLIFINDNDVVCVSLSPDMRIDDVSNISTINYSKSETSKLAFAVFDEQPDAIWPLMDTILEQRDRGKHVPTYHELRSLLERWHDACWDDPTRRLLLFEDLLEDTKQALGKQDDADT